ncbi:MAG TPA: hypothetical protein VLT61_13745, partial [Anaeromyxobacteraceae bacterium]|nr:hypothetical protein [Anaeromyxobacteraceae bacterium]
PRPPALPPAAAPGPSAREASPPPGSAAPPTPDVVEIADILEAEPWVTPETAGGIPPPAAAGGLQPATVGEVLAALSSGPAHAPPSHPVAPPVQPEEPEPTPLGFDEAVRFLSGVEDRDEIARTVLRYARSKFKRAVLLTINRGAASGWAGLGEKLGPAAVRRMQLDLAAPGIVETVVRTRAHFLGPIPKTNANVRLLKLLGGGVPGNALLVPILALGRVVNVFYADAGKGAMVDASGVGELLILATRIAKSYESLVERV